jgi:glyoxylase-like metal-dependent hydrolase (beta-lactamase superfamily II)
MQLTEHVYLVGSGALGFDMTDPFDCHVYLIDGGTELALVDTGAGMGHAEILANITAHGFRLDRLRTVLLTHAHADHSGGAAALHEELGALVAASPRAADYVKRGDEAAISLPAAREAGIYPDAYRFAACPVERELREGDEVLVGKRRLTVLETPGHSADHISFLMDGEQQVLFAGDAIFHGGKLLLQYIPDCSIWEYGQTVEKLFHLRVDVLLPGHLSISLHGAARHIAAARARLATLAVPHSIND